MKVGFLIIGRLKSTRLPKKLLLEVKNKPFISHMIDRVKLSKHTDVIVICTSTNPQDDPLEELANINHVECFRGDEDDVLKRLYDASVTYDLDYILTITADCPLVDPGFADKIVGAYQKTNADLIRVLDLPHGAYCKGMKPSALKKVLEIKADSDTEVWGRYFTDTGLFSVYDLPVENLKFRRPHLRMTLDYPEDYEFFKAIFKNLYQSNRVFSLNEIIDFLDANPDVVKINEKCEALYEKRWVSQSGIKLKERFSVKKIGIVGCGSIGQRHIRALKKISNFQIAAYRTFSGHTNKLPDDLDIIEYDDWRSFLDFKSDVVLICNPTSLHLETAMKLASQVKGLFIEKPVSDTFTTHDTLIDLMEAHRVVSFVGYSLLHHPIVDVIKKEVNKNDLGDPLVFQCQVGQWLPNWHPYEDYRKGYYGRKDLGGGAALTLSHEINLALDLFGEPFRVAAFQPESDRLKIDVDTITDIMLHHKKHVVSQIHLDYIQDPIHREGVISFERGWIKYDFIQQQLSMKTKDTEGKAILWHDPDYDTNEMYIQQMRCFLELVQKGRVRHPYDFFKGLQVLRVIEGAFKSIDSSKVIKVDLSGTEDTW